MIKRLGFGCSIRSTVKLRIWIWLVMATSFTDGGRSWFSVNLDRGALDLCSVMIGPISNRMASKALISPIFSATLEVSMTLWSLHRQASSERIHIWIDCSGPTDTTARSLFLDLCYFILWLQLRNHPSDGSERANLSSGSPTPGAASHCDEWVRFFLLLCNCGRSSFGQFAPLHSLHR